MIKETSSVNSTPNPSLSKDASFISIPEDRGLPPDTQEIISKRFKAREKDR